MKRFLTNSRLVIVILTAILFVLSNVLSGEEGWVGGRCVRSLTSPSEDDHPYVTWRTYGAPLKFLTITTEGCFDNRVTQTDWYFEWLLVDIVTSVALGVALYWLSLLCRRFRGRGKEAIEER